MISRWRRLILLGVVLLAALICAPFCVQYYFRWEARRELDQVIASLDQTDPRWRLDDVEADRRQLPAEENSASLVAAAATLLPKTWNSPISVDLDKTPPPCELREDQADALAKELQSLAAAIQTARALKDRPFGRYKMEYAPDFISTPVGDRHHIRTVVALLEMDVCDCVQRQDMEQAWRSHQALLNAGRSLGDEPTLIAALIRVAMDHYAVRSLERALANGSFLPAALAERQQALTEEGEVPFFLLGMRGERAGNHLLLSNVESGKLSLLRTLENVGRRNVDQSAGWFDCIHEFFADSMVLRSHTTLLRRETEMIEAAKLPSEQRHGALAQIDKSVRAQVLNDRSQVLARLLITAVVKVAEAEQRVHTLLACGVAGLAIERFRLQRGQWPDSLDAVAEAGFLKKVPTDLHDGKPLRFRRAVDGVVIYSVGKDGQNDGKSLDDLAAYVPTGLRVEFRLWDPAHRRQSLPPKLEQSDVP
jgi:hypothetical protein